MANSAKTTKLKSQPNLNYYHHVLEHMVLYKYFRRVNKDEDDKKLLVLPVPKEIKMADEAVANAIESSKFANTLD